MPASKTLILAVAAAAAAGAGYVAKNLMAPQAPVVVEAAVQPEIPLTEVLVLTGDVPMGQPLNQNIAWEKWPAAGVSDGFMTKTSDPEAVEQFSKSLARVNLYKGEPLRKSKLVGEGASFMSSILPKGFRAVATQIAADTSAGGLIRPNDYVDVIMTRKQPNSGTQGAGDQFVTETILKNIKVLAIDQAFQEDEEGGQVKVGETATLELTPQQAEIITVAQQMADRLTLALRSISDTQEKGMEDADYLVGGSGKRGTVRLIKNGEVSEEGARQ